MENMTHKGEPIIKIIKTDKEQDILDFITEYCKKEHLQHENFEAIREVVSVIYCFYNGNTRQLFTNQEGSINIIGKPIFEKEYEYKILRYKIKEC